MPKRIVKPAKSPKPPAKPQAAKWDLMTLLKTDIGELEFSRSLRRLGNIRVMEWDFRTVLPAVKKIANREVDLLGIVKRTAHYKVMDWDFRSALPARGKPASPTPPAPPAKCMSRAEMQALSGRLQQFLHYVVANLVDEPAHAHIEVTPIAPNGLSFKLVLVNRDVTMLIGRGGFTASAIRRILKTAAAMHGVWVLLQIHSQQEAMALAAKDEARH
jgi:predicted RNA-binding protein YlqC (UPF0109 family)